MTEASEPFRFLSLPSELRVRIYKLLLEPASLPLCMTRARNILKRRLTYSFEPVILRICRRIYTEARSILIHNRVVKVKYFGCAEFSPLYRVPVICCDEGAEADPGTEPIHVAKVIIRALESCKDPNNIRDEAHRKEVFCNHEEVQQSFYLPLKSFASWIWNMAGEQAHQLPTTVSCLMPSDAVTRNAVTFQLKVSFPKIPLNILERQHSHSCTTEVLDAIDVEEDTLRALEPLQHPNNSFTIKARKHQKKAESFTDAVYAKFTSARDWFEHVLDASTRRKHCQDCITLACFRSGWPRLREYVLLTEVLHDAIRALQSLPAIELDALESIHHRLRYLLITCCVSKYGITQQNGGQINHLPEMQEDSSCRLDSCICAPLKNVGIDLDRHEPPDWLPHPKIWWDLIHLYLINHEVGDRSYEDIDFKELSEKLSTIYEELDHPGNDGCLYWDLERVNRILQGNIEQSWLENIPGLLHFYFFPARLAPTDDLERPASAATGCIFVEEQPEMELFDNIFLGRIPPRALQKNSG